MNSFYTTFSESINSQIISFSSRCMIQTDMVFIEQIFTFSTTIHHCFLRHLKAKEKENAANDNTDSYLLPIATLDDGVSVGE